MFNNWWFFFFLIFIMMIIYQIKLSLVYQTWRGRLYVNMPYLNINLPVLTFLLRLYILNSKSIFFAICKLVNKRTWIFTCGLWFLNPTVFHYFFKRLRFLINIPETYHSIDYLAYYEINLSLMYVIKLLNESIY